mmetsp:Transcript_13933/g.44678  ORF Transcript_13933/g.44678 Transcript_13933/m.44678 type:complete len:230 (-) Transcript_13933:522-1211(-)
MMGIIKLAPRLSAISRPPGLMACSAVVAAMFTLPHTTRVSASMRVVSSKASSCRRFLPSGSLCSGCSSIQRCPTGVSSCSTYGPMPTMSARNSLKNRTSPARSRLVCPGSPTMTPVPTWNPMSRRLCRHSTRRCHEWSAGCSSAYSSGDDVSMRSRYLCAPASNRRWYHSRSSSPSDSAMPKPRHSSTGFPVFSASRSLLSRLISRITCSMLRRRCSTGSSPLCSMMLP